MRCQILVAVVACASSSSVLAEARMPSRALNLSVGAGAGTENFIAPALGDLVGLGPSWNVRVAIGAPRAIRLEGLYTGSAQPLRGDNDGTLVGHGAQLVLRFNFAPWLGDLEPFTTLGIGWTRFHVDGDPVAGMRDRDNVLEIPLGAGIAYRWGRLVADARAGLSVVTGADLVPSTDPTTSAEGETMHRFALRAGVAVEL